MIPVASKPCICERNERGCVKWKMECEACAAYCDDPHAEPLTWCPHGRRSGTLCPHCAGVNQ